MPDILSFTLLILRWVHFLGGVGWIGTIFYLGMVELPSVKREKVGPFSSEYVSKLNNLLITTSISSVVAGVSMALIISRLNTETFVFSYWGISIFLGGLLALAALVATFAGVVPSLERLSSTELSEAERGLVISRGQRWLNVTIGLGITVLLMMASAGSPLI